MNERSAHRSGPFKQDNKPHKVGRHRSNRSISSSNKGRELDVKRITKQKDSLKRHERRNQLKQMREHRREQVIANKRLLGKESFAPIIVAILPLMSDNLCVDDFIGLIQNCDKSSFVNNSFRNIHITINKLKTKFELLIIDKFDVNSALDTVKIADILIVLHSFSSHDNSILDAIYNHCLPTTVHVICGLSDFRFNKRNELKKEIQKYIDYKFGDEKLRSVDTESEALQLMYYLSNCRRKQSSFRSHRPQVLAEIIDYESINTDTDGDNQTFGTLRVTGYVRNRTLDVNSLVHIPGFGDFQMSFIETFNDPNIDNRKNSNDVENSSRIIQKADHSQQQSLEIENMVNPMEGEQTWPSQEELENARKERNVLKKLVPKGTSEYQAVWIVDNNDENDDSDSNSQDSDDDLVLKMEAQALNSDDDVKSDDMEDEDDDEREEYDELSINESANDTHYDEKIDANEEESMYKKFKAERMDQMFPDETDTPYDNPARIRFSRYRGLKSFRTSTWDPKENLPKDYARIYQIENFSRMKRRVFNEETFGAECGWFVTIHVTNVPLSVYEFFKNNKKPLILYGLLPHEQKMSVINLVLKRHSSFTEPIKSKEKLIFHVGCRRFSASPIFSSHTNGDKHKLERFLRSDVSVVATLYAPITYPPASVLVFKKYEDGSQHLVATGSLLSCNPDRVIIKRVVLSGHPFKINRKHAVVRYMFFNREDILWFKPIELRTKYGRKGHIKEPLGTHGHMKCSFDRQLKSQDTVLMNLYKRVYPKWTYDSNVSFDLINSNCNIDKISEMQH